MARRAATKRKSETPKKATAAEITKRVNKVYQLLLDGLSRADILEYVAKKTEWKVSDGSVDEYIAKATAEIKARSTIVRDEEYGKALERLRMLYSRNIMIQDFKAALAVQKEINELLGLYPAKKIEHGGKDGKPIKLLIGWDDGNSGIFAED